MYSSPTCDASKDCLTVAAFVDLSLENFLIGERVGVELGVVDDMIRAQ